MLRETSKVVYEELRKRNPDGSTSTRVHRLDQMPTLEGFLDMDTFAKMSQVTAAFSPRDLQVARTINHWLKYNELSMDMLPLFIQMQELYKTLSTINYFTPTPSLEHSKAIRRFEGTLSKKARIELRKIRLKYTRQGNAGNG